MAAVLRQRKRRPSAIGQPVEAAREAFGDEQRADAERKGSSGESSEDGFVKVRSDERQALPEAEGAESGLLKINYKIFLKVFRNR